jgi:hypothetical protein
MNTKFFLLCTDGATFAFPTAELLAEARTQFLLAVTFEHGRAVLPGEAWTVEAVGTRAPMFSAPADVYDHVANLAVFG